MELSDLIKGLEGMLPEKVPYGDLIGAEGLYAHSGPLVYEDPEPYFIEQAIAELKKLSEIQDILGPVYDADRLRELIQAAREGLVTRLLFKVGDKVYDISCGKIVEKQVISITFLLSRSQAHICYHAENARHAVTTIEPEDIGESIFLNLGEAEAAMAKAKEAAHEYTGK